MSLSTIILILSIAGNIILFLCLKLSQSNLSQAKRMLDGTLDEKDRLRDIIKAYRNN
jgi:hypothetical protein